MKFATENHKILLPEILGWYVIQTKKNFESLSTLTSKKVFKCQFEILIKWLFEIQIKFHCSYRNFRYL
jgi:hypothetical protein